jgi:hypothetical protein
LEATHAAYVFPLPSISRGILLTVTSIKQLEQEMEQMQGSARSGRR